MNRGCSRRSSDSSRSSRAAQVQIRGQRLFLLQIDEVVSSPLKIALIDAAFSFGDHGRTIFGVNRLFDEFDERNVVEQFVDDVVHPVVSHLVEWFFIPAPNVRVNEKLILPHEPIRRGGGKPHMCEQLYRDGGTTVYVFSRHPNGLTGDEYRKLLKENPAAAKWGWRTMARNPVVYVRGKITHPDHATIRLNGWHRVEMNTENRSRAMASVAFLD